MGYLKAGDRLCTGQAEILCLYPDAGQEAEDSNDLCLTLQYTDSGMKALFAGDISSGVEEALVERGCLEKVDFYKADHHGSNGSSCEGFLQVIDPTITAASAGADNRYGHPGNRAVERITESGSRFYCTIDSGQVKVKREKNGKYAVFTKKQICYTCIRENFNP